MRIVAGTFRGRSLVAPKGHSTRPTADRTRQAMFDVLEHAPWSRPLAGARVIDLFAGSGALGLEALSRGAAFCLFLETRAEARAAIAANAEKLALGDRQRIAARDATRLHRRGGADGEVFDLAFLDPPYSQGLAEPALAALAAGDWLAPGAIVVVELGAGEALRPDPAYQSLDERNWGAAQVRFLRRL